MNQRRRLTKEERNEAMEQAVAQNGGKRVHVQEWTDLDGRPVIVTILEQ